MTKPMTFEEANRVVAVFGNTPTIALSGPDFRLLTRAQTFLNKRDAKITTKVIARAGQNPLFG